eukprot:scaffold22576_cov129-Cylindrotheca_fusiformis.AAC.2
MEIGKCHDDNTKFHVSIATHSCNSHEGHDPDNGQDGLIMDRETVNGNVVDASDHLDVEEVCKNRRRIVFSNDQPDIELGRFGTFNRDDSVTTEHIQLSPGSSQMAMEPWAVLSQFGGDRSEIWGRILKKGIGDRSWGQEL